MSKLSRDEQDTQIMASFTYLSDIGCLSERTYCHPFGGFHSFNNDTLELLSKNNVLYSFNVEPRDIDLSDINNSRHFLPRYDCNQFPYGQAS